MSGRVAVATCISCETPLDENWNVCPQCGTSASASSSGGKKASADSTKGRPTFTQAPGQPDIEFTFGPRHILSEGEKLGRQYEVVKALGAGGFGEVYQVRDSTLDQEIAVNLTAVIKLTYLLLPVLARQPEAAVVNVSSLPGLIPKKSAPMYCATKAAVHAFSKALRYQLADTAVKVFEVTPPLVDTGMVQGPRSRQRHWCKRC